MSTQHDRLQEAMRAAGKGWDDVKVAMSLTRAGIKEWRDGDFKEMTAANVFALADFLRCDARWLALGDRGQPGSGGFSQLRAIWSSVNDDGRREMLTHATYIAAQERFRPPPASVTRIRS